MVHVRTRKNKRPFFKCGRMVYPRKIDAEKRIQRRDERAFFDRQLGAYIIVRVKCSSRKNRQSKKNK